jgi:hypothetical protein
MKRRRLAIVGFGRLGQACGSAILESDDLALAGIVRRPDTLLSPRPAQFADVSTVSHASELGELDAALICLPTALVREAATDLLQHHTHRRGGCLRYRLASDALAHDRSNGGSARRPTLRWRWPHRPASGKPSRGHGFRVSVSVDSQAQIDLSHTRIVQQVSRRSGQGNPA